jgi:hypothetical protein
MKTRIAALSIISTVWVQDVSEPSGPVTRDIGKRFQHEFRNASQVRWVRIKDIFQVRFNLNADYCLAFFNTAGELLMSGRRIPMATLPPVVKKEVDRLWTLSESKYDLLYVAGVYQLNNVRGSRYFINLESEYLSMSIVASEDGSVEIVKNIIHPKPVMRMRMQPAEEGDSLSAQRQGGSPAHHA